MNYTVDSNFMNNYTNSTASTLNGISAVPSKPSHVNFINKNKLQASTFVRRIGVNNVDYFSSMTNKHPNNSNPSNAPTSHNESNEFVVTRPLNYAKASSQNPNTLGNLSNGYTSSQTNIYKNPLSFFNTNSNSSNALTSNSFNNNMTSSSNSLMPSSSTNLNLNQLSGINPTNYYYFDQNFKLNKKNTNQLRQHGMTNENKLKTGGGGDSITLPQVKQIECKLSAL